MAEQRTTEAAGANRSGGVHARERGRSRCPGTGGASRLAAGAKWAAGAPAVPCWKIRRPSRCRNRFPEQRETDCAPPGAGDMSR